MVVETVQVWSLFLMYLVRENKELMKFCLEILAFYLNVERFLFLLLFYAIFNHFDIFFFFIIPMSLEIFLHELSGMSFLWVSVCIHSYLRGFVGRVVTV